MLFKEHHKNIYTMTWAWESLGDRRWCCKLTLFYKIVNGFAPKYLANYLNINDIWVYKTRASEHNNIKRFGTRTENFKQSFFLYCVNKWCKLDISLRKAENAKRFNSMLKDFVNLKQKPLFAIHDPGGVKLLSSLRLILKMLWALCVTVAPKLNQQTTFSCVACFFAINRQKLVIDLLKIGPS